MARTLPEKFRRRYQAPLPVTAGHGNPAAADTSGHCRFRSIVAKADLMQLTDLCTRRIFFVAAIPYFCGIGFVLGSKQGLRVTESAPVRKFFSLNCCTGEMIAPELGVGNILIPGGFYVKAHQAVQKPRK